MLYLTKISNAGSEFTENEQKIADFLQANVSELQSVSSRQMAKQLGISQSSIVKFAQKLGAQATGANKLEEILYGVLPQVMPLLISYSLYRFESNVRSATVVGMVGAGGIGVTLWEAIRGFQFQQTCALMVLIIVTVSLLDFLSQRLRKHFI